MEFRIYVNGKLINICSSDFALMNNISSYNSKYGKENVEVKHVERIMDDEKKEYLNHMMDEMQLD